MVRGHAPSAPPSPTSLHAEIERQLGVLPNFFQLVPEVPEIAASLWGFARFAYLGNPLPSQFKERLFVYLSRFCEVRYCIARHVGFLVGLGHCAGDPDVPPQSIESVVRLISQPLARDAVLATHLSACERRDAPMDGTPDAETTMEEAVFACTAHVFLQTEVASRCLEALRRVMNPPQFHHLTVFLTFVRAAHYWTKVHPELGFEDDIKTLLTTHERLANCVLDDPEATCTSEVSQRLLDELSNLRREKEHNEALGRARERIQAIEQRREAERKLAEEERERLLVSERAARADAERASGMKDEFLATLSHELRTPLNAILGWSEILLSARPRGEKDLLRGLQTISRNARAQAKMIEDLLDMSRIISGKLRLEMQGIDLVSLIEATVETVKPAAAAKGVDIQAALDPSLRALSGDPDRLQQVVWNLLSNAVKFTPANGGVQVILKRVDTQVEISVIDTGEGIAAAFLPHVFDRFRQADASITRHHGGLGLGLSIVKQLVELHGGSVSVESPGVRKGSTFTVSLPLVWMQPEPSRVAELLNAADGPGHLDVSLDLGAKLVGLKVLVVDDDPDARGFIEQVLEQRGATVVTAGSAAAALDRLREGRMDVLVSDIAMPGEDGYALLKRIRALGPEHGGNLPSLALTAYARAEDRVKAVLAGFQMHMSKPVDPRELIAMVASLSGRTKN